jgi:hypothetical protein
LAMNTQIPGAGGSNKAKATARRRRISGTNTSFDAFGLYVQHEYMRR